MDCIELNRTRKKKNRKNRNDVAAEEPHDRKVHRALRMLQAAYNRPFVNAVRYGREYDVQMQKTLKPFLKKTEG